MYDDLLNEHPKLYEKASIIFNPVSGQIADYAKSQEIISVMKKDYILCVGRLEKVKAFNYAIEAFAGISNKFSNLRLKIVGTGKLEEELKKKASELSVLDRVDFEGFQQNIIPYYLYAKATMLTSLYEGYPNALIESIALGTPVIAFDCRCGPDEIIQDNINGFLVRHLDVEDLKDKMGKILDTNFNRKKIILTAKNNQIEHVSELYEKLIKSMINF
jgi:glycosyltransferase involved in cell wall biosynthesis